MPRLVTFPLTEETSIPCDARIPVVAKETRTYKPSQCTTTAKYRLMDSEGGRFYCCESCKWSLTHQTKQWFGWFDDGKLPAHFPTGN